MFASLTGYRDESFSEPPLFSLNILGEGLLTLTNEPRSFSGLVSTTEFRYRLAPVAAPVPEPLTAGLVAAGLAVVARRYQRDRARRRVPG